MIQAFVCLMLAVILGTAILAYVTDDEKFLGLQFLAMLSMIVVVPILALLLS
jgi:hypothetical protein